MAGRRGRDKAGCGQRPVPPPPPVYRRQRGSLPPSSRGLLCAEAMGADAGCCPAGGGFSKAVFHQKTPRLFRPHDSMVQAGVLKLFPPPDIVQQAGADQHVFVCSLFRPGDVQRGVQHPVDVLLIVGVVFHTLEHIFSGGREIFCLVLFSRVPPLKSAAARRRRGAAAPPAPARGPAGRPAAGPRPRQTNIPLRSPAR